MFKEDSLAMSVHGRIANVQANILLDSGASDCFVDEQFAKRVGIHARLTKNETLTLGDGHTSCVTGMVKLHLSLGAFHGSHKFFVTRLGNGVDVVLGDDWLRTRKAILDYGKGTCIVKKGHRRITLEDSMRHGRRLSEDMPSLRGHDSGASPLLSNLQLKRALRKECKLFLINLETIEDQMEDEVEWNVASPKAPSPLQHVLDEYKDVFPNELPSGLPPDRGLGHTIPLETGHKPPFRPLYRLSPLEQQEVKKQVEDMLAKGWIEPSKSPYGAPVLFVQKKDGTLRMCVDYRALNTQTIKNRYALPRIDDLLDQLQGAKVFTSLDLAQGYHQIRITEEDVPKTAFRTPLGHFQYRVLCFGLSNAPATFQSVMNDIFRPYLGKFVLVYLDDILIFSKTPEEHIEHVRKVMEVLRHNRFYVKAKKCTFMKEELLYLGHIIGEDGIRPDPAKVAAIKEWAIPKDKHQLRSFLGFGNYFRKFIQGYSKLVAPLTRLTGDKVSFEWTPPCQEAFDGVKWNLTHAPTLALADSSKPYELIADASGFALGAVLLQEGRPIAFESRKVNSAEQNYFATEQECLAVVHALRTWRCYLEGVGTLTVVTDHKPNTYLSQQEHLSRRQARWSEFLQRFPIQWVYRPGRHNCADALSRHHRHLSVMTRRRAALLRNDHPQEGLITQPEAPAGEAIKGLAAASAGGSPFDAYLPPDDPRAELKQLLIDGYAHDPMFHGDPGLDNRNITALVERDGLWYHGQQIAVPSDPHVRELILREFHDPPHCGHMGMAKTSKSLAREYWWPGLAHDVQAYCRTCVTCQRDKAHNRKQAGLLKPLPIPHRKWGSLGMDFITSLPMTKNGHDTILVFIDRLSKMCHFVATKSTLTTMECAKLYIDNIFRLHGLQDSIVSDRDKLFTTPLWLAILQGLNMSPDMSSPFHPQTDGQTERANRVLEDYLRHYIAPDQKDWDEWLSMAEYVINDSYQESIKCTPFELNYGEHPLNPLSLRSKMVSREFQLPSAQAFFARMSNAVHKARTALKQAQDRQKSYADKSREDVQFQVSQKVLLNTKNLTVQSPGVRKLFPKWVGPFEVIERVGTLAYRLNLPPNMKCHPVFHVSNLRAYRYDGRSQPPPAPIMIDGEPEYEVERILDHRQRQGSTKRQYLCKWVGYGAEHNTWEPERNLENCAELLREYWASKPLPHGVPVQARVFAS